MKFSAEYVGPSLISLHRPEGPIKGAVLLCGPLFHEYFKAHFWLRQLANSLAQSGLLAVRFDYTGQGDSLRDAGGVRLADWREDIHRAATIAGERAVGRPLHMVTVRLSNLLLDLCQPASGRRIQVDAIERGDDYLQALRASHAELLARQPSVPPSSPEGGDERGHEELLGDRYAGTLMQEIGGLAAKSASSEQLESGFDWASIHLERAYLPAVTHRIVGMLSP